MSVCAESQEELSQRVRAQATKAMASFKQKFSHKRVSFFPLLDLLDSFAKLLRKKFSKKFEKGKVWKCVLSTSPLLSISLSLSSLSLSLSSLSLFPSLTLSLSLSLSLSLFTCLCLPQFLNPLSHVS